MNPSWMRLNRSLLLALIAGAFLGLSWPPLPFFALLFIAFLPLLMLCDQPGPMPVASLSLFILACFGLRYSITLYWIALASPMACFIAVFSLSVVFTCVFLVYRFMKMQFQTRLPAYLALISLWITAEWFCEGVLRAPWCNLGLGLAKAPFLVQWYEWTGIEGGSVWIWIVNILVFELYRSYRLASGSNLRKPQIGILAGLTAALLGPIAFSLVRDQTYIPTMNAAQVTVIQTNFSALAPTADLEGKIALDRLLLLSSRGMQRNTEYLIWPESALEPGRVLNEDSLETDPGITRIRSFLGAYPNTSLVTGVRTYVRNFKSHQDTAWFNSAISIQKGEAIRVYHKNILVPGTESSFFLLSKNGSQPFLDFGRPSRTFQTGTPLLFYSQEGMGLAPAICFESVFNSYVAHDLVPKGASMISVLSNDAWWGTSSGTWQHAAYISLLAIECRRPVASSSNGGISRLVDEQGKIIAQAAPQTEAVVKGELLTQEEPSFYSKYPLVMRWLCLIVALASIGIAGVRQLIGYRHLY